ncbi:hypothetical protein [Erythrobacter crassostreae]|uniref:Uncharacterized protein n=1 Tax=Erythrobacter crassostreae TaxID=2828328 RepID=A0A9X1F1N3_9SPHN|nr:hypothetical protein [Erythrobacter crassostrea]MBV7258675.1 hypothetical protein [Erythrobacter crassostrea]
MTSPDDDELASEEGLEEIADAFVFAFGLAGPLDWVAELNQRLIAPAGRLANSRAAYDDPTRDSTDEIDAESKAKIRIAVNDYLSEIFQMLHAMPLFQQQPQILEPLKFVITEIASVEKGRTLHWLQADPSKQHYTLSTKEAEWVPIIAALQLALLLSKINGEDPAVKHLKGKKALPSVTTIKEWHAKLFNKGKSGSLPDPSKKIAAESIRSIVSEMRAVLLVAQGPEARDRLLNRRIDDLLSL